MSESTADPYFWTEEQTAAVETGFRAGDSINAMARRLNRGRNAIRRKLQRMGLLARKPRPAFRGDHRFQQAMNAAISMGHETVTPGTFVDTSPPDHLIRPMRGEGDSGYRSSAGYAADMGDSGGIW